ncbi:MAG: hypothetical protein ABIV13_02335, partial [Fimbriimonadales bacterium]
MVFEPALTRNDWFGLFAIFALVAVLVGVTVYLAVVARRSSARSLVSVLALSWFVLAGVARLAADRLHTLCAVEFTEQ